MATKKDKTAKSSESAQHGRVIDLNANGGDLVRRSKAVSEARNQPRESKTRRYVSPLAASIHESMEDLHAIGLIEERTMRDFDESCLTTVCEFDGEAIKRLRVREQASQAVLARYLGVSLNAVGQWERGERKATGAAAKLLALVDRHGLDYVK